MTSDFSLLSEDLLQKDYPEVYSRPIKRVKFSKLKKKKPYDDISDSEVDLVSVVPRTRRSRWTGRRVNNFVRPGAAFVYEPPIRSVEKRSYDEVYADNDILEQALNRSNEFYYGKKPNIEAIVLDNSNPTPSLTPVTPQVPIGAQSSVSGMEVQPTVQVMTYTGASAPSETPMEVENVKIRAPKQVAPGIAVQTVDLEVPLGRDVGTQTVTRNVSATNDMATQTNFFPSQTRYPRYVSYRRRIPQVVYHPSINMTPLPSTKRRRRRRKRTRVRRPTIFERIHYANLIPKVTYHPSIIP